MVSSAERDHELGASSVCGRATAPPRLLPVRVQRRPAHKQTVFHAQVPRQPGHVLQALALRERPVGQEGHQGPHLRACVLLGPHCCVCRQRSRQPVRILHSHTQAVGRGACAAGSCRGRADRARALVSRDRSVVSRCPFDLLSPGHGQDVGVAQAGTSPQRRQVQRAGCVCIVVALAGLERRRLRRPVCMSEADPWCDMVNP